VTLSIFGERGWIKSHLEEVVQETLRQRMLGTEQSFRDGEEGQELETPELFYALDLD
jgi:hypothetical protein